MSHRILSTFWVSVFAVAHLLAVDGLHATETSVRCGDIVRGEFTKPEEILDYVLYMEAGQIIRIQAIPVGDFLNFRTQVLEPAGNLIYDSGEYDSDLEHDPNVRTGTLSANGTYRIRLWNYGWSSTGNAGVFSLHIGCILADGTEVNPGASAPAAPPPPSPPSPSPPLTTSARAASPSSSPAVVAMRPAAGGSEGLPGLTLSELAALPFEKIGLGRELEGEISTQGIQVAGLRFDAEQGTEVDLTFRRRSGNLNLGLILLDPYQQVAFQAALVVNSRVTPRLKMPIRGEYTVGIATIGPLPPSAAKTGFTIALTAVGSTADTWDGAAAGSGAGDPAVHLALLRPANAPAAGRTAPPAARAAASPARWGVTLYEDGNFRGRQETFYADDPGLHNNPIRHNTASSVRVAPGCHVVLYRRPFYLGRSTALDGDVANLRESQVGNDAVASLRVYCN